MHGISTRAELHEVVSKRGLGCEVQVYGALYGESSTSARHDLIIGERDMNGGSFSGLKLSLGSISVPPLERQVSRDWAADQYGLQVWVTGVVGLSDRNELQLRVSGVRAGICYLDSYWGWVRSQFQEAEKLLGRPKRTSGGARVARVNRSDWTEVVRQRRKGVVRCAWLGRSTSEGFSDAQPRGKTVRDRIIIEPMGAAMAGPRAVDEILGAIRRANEQSFDVLILARGGGPRADLALFNDVRLVEALRASSVPVLVALGHTRDRPLVTHVATQSFSTPSTMRAMLSKLSGHSSPPKCGLQPGHEEAEVEGLRSSVGVLERRVADAESRLQMEIGQRFTDEAARAAESAAVAAAARRSEVMAKRAESWAFRYRVSLVAAAASAGALVAEQQPWVGALEIPLFCAAGVSSVLAMAFRWKQRLIESRNG